MMMRREMEQDMRIISCLLSGTDCQIRETIASRNIVIRWIVYYLAIFSIIILGIYGSGYDASDFIYMKF